MLSKKLTSVLHERAKSVPFIEQTNFLGKL